MKIALGPFMHRHLTQDHLPSMRAEMQRLIDTYGVGK